MLCPQKKSCCLKLDAKVGERPSLQQWGATAQNTMLQVFNVVIIRSVKISLVHIETMVVQSRLWRAAIGNYWEELT